MTEIHLPHDSLAGTVILVAGATGPIGRATALTLATAGASVAVHCRSNMAAAEELADSLPGSSLAVTADLTNAASLGKAMDAVEARLGVVASVVNAAHARMPTARTVAEMEPAVLHEQLAGVLGHAALCQRLIPGMRDAGRGRIVYVSGALATRPVEGFSAFGAAKSAATTMTKYLALEEGRHGITANVVAPGRVVDELAEFALDPTRAELSDRLRQRLAFKDFPSPQDVANAIATFIGPGSGAITGQVIWVTGGEPIG